MKLSKTDALKHRLVTSFVVTVTSASAHVGVRADDGRVAAVAGVDPDVIISTRADLGVHGGGDRVDRAAGAEPVVLQLLEGVNVGVQGGDREDLLG